MALILDGTGSITGISAGGLPDASITQAELATGVAGTGPAFSAYQSSAQTLSSSTTTKIQFQTEEFDTASCFDNATNYRFAPNVAGYYQANGGLQMAASATVIVVYLYKNGSNFKQLFSSNSSNVSGGYGSALVYLNGSTDYIELYANISTGQGLNATAANVYFQASMVRAA